jgi:hypothetical protein
VNQALVSSDDIQSVTPLAAGRPVYLLLGADHSHVVIKSEVTRLAHDSTNLKFANRAMRTVSPAFASKVCTPNEVAVLKDFVQWEMWIADYMSAPRPAEIVHLDNSLQNGGVWFKMDKAEGILDLGDAVQKAINQQDKTGVRRIAAALCAKGGLEALGKIIVADLFNGNTDRFNPFNKDPFRDGAIMQAGAMNPRTNTKFNVLLNLGNVLVSMQNNKLRPIGLDAYEAQGAWRKLDKKISEIEQAEHEDWPGRHLSNDPAEAQWRVQFAALVISDLDATLGPRNRKVAWGRTRRLPKDATARLISGFNAGIAELKTNFVRFVNKQGKVRPVGLTDRLQILGW